MNWKSKAHKTIEQRWEHLHYRADIGVRGVRAAKKAVIKKTDAGLPTMCVLGARYLRRDAQRRVVERPEALFARVAEAAAKAEGLFDNAAEIPRWRDAIRRSADYDDQN